MDVYVVLVLIVVTLIYTGHVSTNRPLLDSYLEVYEGLCRVKKVYNAALHQIIVSNLTFWS